MYTKIKIKNCPSNITQKDKNLDGRKAFINQLILPVFCLQIVQGNIHYFKKREKNDILHLLVTITAYQITPKLSSLKQ